MQEGWRVGVVIPAHNEGEHIRNVLETLPDWIDTAIVVNDGSTDNTQGEVESATTDCEVILVSQMNQGVGSAIDAGHRRMLNHLNIPFVSVVMAGDGQMNPDDLRELIAPIIQNKADHVKGDRLSHPDGFNRMPKIRQLASWILAFFTTLAAGQSIRDPQCGYTATSHRIIETWNWRESWKGYGYPNYWLIRLSSNGWRILHAPVASVYRKETSGIKPLHFFLTVGLMMTIEHHRRTFGWLRKRQGFPLTLMAFFAYLMGWGMLLPSNINPVKEVMSTWGAPTFVLVCGFWALAHLFDRRAAASIREARLDASN
ncbi:MAG: glycosyltransferase family 2 protein [Candidatus Poseidonia sp.]|nr:glycosyltransferase family 2 protein [Poseidonia sp.]